MQPWAPEARRAWRVAVRRIHGAGARDRFLSLVIAVGVVSLFVIALRIQAVFDERPVGTFVLGVVTALLLGLLIGVPAWLARRDRRRTNERLARARAGAPECPRCAASLEVSESVGASERTCEACGARLLEAAGLLVVSIEDRSLREERWSAAATRRLSHVRASPALEPVLWLAAGVLALGLQVGAASLVGVAVGVPDSFEASMGERREVPHDGTARARGVELDSALPAGAATRAHAPLWVGTQVLARTGEGPHHAFAVVVRVRDGQAFVVYADGDSGWVSRPGLLAPEIAAFDQVEVYDGARWQPAEIQARVGPAVRVRGGWTSMSRMRVRVDAAHQPGEGRVSEIPPGAWVEAEVGEATWRPGLAVRSVGLRLHVALGDGSERWFDHEQVRAQALGPGARIFIDGSAEEHIIAARIGHALAVVGPRGGRGWTALSRVRRR